MKFRITGALVILAISIIIALWIAQRRWAAHADRDGLTQIPVTVDDSGSKEVDALVLQLVSKRPAPYRSGHWDAALVARYSTPEVETAIKKLKQMGPRIIPALIKNLEDDRYSYSEDWDAWRNFHVGDAVIEVLSDDHIMHGGYKVRETPSGEHKFYPSFKDYLYARKLEKWAKWACTKTRLEIQLDFIDWCIGQEEERGFIDESQRKWIRDNYEDARESVRKEYSEPVASGT